MGVLETAIDPRSAAYLEARATTMAALTALESALDAARDGGGERAVTRHHARGKLLARERIELLVDRDSPLLELCPVAGAGTSSPTGAATTAALGVVADRPCVLVATDPTVPPDAADARTLRKLRRGLRVAAENRLPLVGLVDPPPGTPPPGTRASAPEPTGPETAAPELAALREAGRTVAGLAELAVAGIPTAGVFFGESTVVAGADLAASFHHVVRVGRPDAGPTRPPPTDQLAEDERDALRLTREFLGRTRTGPGWHAGSRAGAAPKYDPEDLLGIPATEPVELLGRILDGSEWDEVQPWYGPGWCAGWGAVHGHPVAVLAGTGATPADEEVAKAARLASRAGLTGTPLVLLQHGPPPPGPGAAALARAVVAAGAPVLAVRVGPAGGPSPVTTLARFRFAWPTAGTAEMSALHRSGRLDDDGVIDPRDTRTVLGLCLAVLPPGGAR